MTYTAHLRYRCRLCGVEFAGVHSGDGRATSLLIGLCDVETVRNTGGFTPGRFDTHACAPDRTGFADLIGVVRDPEEPS